MKYVEEKKILKIFQVVVCKCVGIFVVYCKLIKTHICHANYKFCENFKTEKWKNLLSCFGAL